MILNVNEMLIFFDITVILKNIEAKVEFTKTKKNKERKVNFFSKKELSKKKYRIRRI